ncbi:MAG: alpha-keto acid decarboxylase family protein [Candidatus Melainabacteria bacterium]|nr:alpha-keto acid decarboxylase family protein [Candidatus Melainabacteria bacterium]
MNLLEFLYKRLKSHGVDHLFGIPGESVHLHFHYLYKSDLEPVILAHEPSLSYAVDAYSRIRGLGAALVSYGVGVLNMVNGVGQAYAESSPMVVISGGPGVNERKKYPYLHHKVRSYDTNQKVMQEVSAHSVIIDNPVTAVSEIDKALNTAIIYKKPVYIEIPRDMCEIEIQDTPYKEESKEIDQDALEEALNEAVKMLNKAKNPVILAGAEPARVGLQKELLSIAEKINAPVASTILGKSIFPEEHPLAMGVYFGQLSNSEVAEYINKSDCVLMLGVILSDINLGMFTAKADLDEAIAANIEGAKIKQHYYPQINLASFMNGLIKRTDIKKHTVDYPKIHIPNYPTGPENSKITIKALLTILNEFIDKDYRVICDVGDCLFAGQEIQMRGASTFLSPAYYLSMGFSIPGAIGAQKAEPKRRPIVMVGDGAFQMTGMELITIAKLKLNPIIVLFNNTIYATLKYCEPPHTAQEHKIPTLDYAKMAEILGGKGITVNSVGDMKNALRVAKDVKDTFTLLNVKIDEKDISPALRTFGEKLGRFVEVSATTKVE